jgi:hypothetical protein
MAKDKPMRFRKADGILIFSVLVAVAGCGPRSNPMPVVEVRLETLVGEWRTNKSTALEIYKGKILEISGIIELATNDTSVLLPMVRLRGADAKDRETAICYFSSADWAKINRLCEEQKLTVRGQLIDGEGKEPTLLNCQLAAIGDSPALAAAIGELIDEYKIDKNKMAEKYDSHWLIVEGFVVEIERPKVKRIQVKENKQIVESEVEDEHCYRYYFKSDDRSVRVCAVCCGYQNDGLLKKCAMVHVGQKIKVIGRCDKIEWRDKKRIELTQCRLLDD